MLPFLIGLNLVRSVNTLAILSTIANALILVVFVQIAYVSVHVLFA
jgi:hypothetical protein